MFKSTSQATTLRRPRWYYNEVGLRFYRNNIKDAEGVIQEGKSTDILITKPLLEVCCFKEGDYIDIEVDDQSNIARLVACKDNRGWKSVANNNPYGYIRVKYTNTDDTLQVTDAKREIFVDDIISAQAGEVIFRLDSRINRIKNPLQYKRNEYMEVQHGDA